MKTYVFAALVLLAAGLAYYGLSPLFKNTYLDEPVPSSRTEVGSLGYTELIANSLDTAPIPIVDTPAHPASGTVRIVTADGAQYVRYENFKTINGPDLFVYLSKDLGASEFVNLGAVKATAGNINYEIPQTVHPREYPYVLVWCKAFGVLFNSAKLY